MSLKLFLCFTLFVQGLVLFRVSQVEGHPHNANCLDLSTIQKASLEFPFQLNQLYSNGRNSFEMSIEIPGYQVYKPIMERMDEESVQSYRFFRGNLKTDCGLNEFNFQVTNAASSKGFCALIPENGFQEAQDEYSIAKKAIQAFEKMNPDVQWKPLSPNLSSLEAQYGELKSNFVNAEASYSTWQAYKTYRPALETLQNNLKHVQSVKYFTITYQLEYLTNERSKFWRFPQLADTIHLMLNEFFAQQQVLPGMQLRFERLSGIKVNTVKGERAFDSDKLRDLFCYSLIQALGNRPFGAHIEVMVTPELMRTKYHRIDGTARISPSVPEMVNPFNKRGCLVLSTFSFESLQTDMMYLTEITKLWAHEILHTLGAVHVNSMHHIMNSFLVRTDVNLPISTFTKVAVFRTYQELRARCKIGKLDPASPICAAPDLEV